MIKRMPVLVVWFCLLSLPSSVFGQKATEIYIPIGESPGLSGIYTVLGTIQEVDAQNRTVTMAGESGEQYTVQLAEETKIWLDRSKIGERNVEGTLADLQEGLRIEVRFSEEDLTGEVLWIKVEITSSG